MKLKKTWANACTMCDRGVISAFCTSNLMLHNIQYYELTPCKNKFTFYLICTVIFWILGKQFEIVPIIINKTLAFQWVLKYPPWHQNYWRLIKYSCYKIIRIWRCIVLIGFADRCLAYCIRQAISSSIPWCWWGFSLSAKEITLPCIPSIVVKGRKKKGL